MPGLSSTTRTRSPPSALSIAGPPGYGTTRSARTEGSCMSVARRDHPVPREAFRPRPPFRRREVPYGRAGYHLLRLLLFCPARRDSQGHFGKLVTLGCPCGAAPPGSAFRPGQDDLAALAGAHDLEALPELVILEVVRDDRADVEPGLEHDRHLVPGFVH